MKGDGGVKKTVNHVESPVVLPPSDPTKSGAIPGDLVGRAYGEAAQQPEDERTDAWNTDS